MVEKRAYYVKGWPAKLSACEFHIEQWFNNSCTKYLLTYLLVFKAGKLSRTEATVGDSSKIHFLLRGKVFRIKRLMVLVLGLSFIASATPSATISS